MTLLALDPGSDQTAFVLFDPTRARPVLEHGGLVVVRREHRNTLPARLHVDDGAYRDFAARHRVSHEGT